MVQQWEEYSVLKKSIRLRLLEFIMIPVRQTFMLQQDKHTNIHLNTANKSVHLWQRQQ